MESLYRISDYYIICLIEYSEFPNFYSPFIFSPLPTMFHIVPGICLVGSSLAGGVVVVKIREKFGDGTRKLPIQELAYSYASW